MGGQLKITIKKIESLVTDKASLLAEMIQLFLCC
jgi:hypothetical protein